MTIFIGLGITFCGILVAGWSGGYVKAVGILMILGGLVASAVGLVRLIVRLFVRFWRWGTGRSQIEEAEPEEVKEDEPERIDLEEVARIAEIAVLRHMVELLDEAPSAPSAENVVIEEANDEDAADDDEDAEEEEEEEEQSDALKWCLSEAERAKAEEEREEDIEYLEGYITQLRKRLDVLLKRHDKLVALGTDKNTRTWRGNAYDIDYTMREIENSKDELKRIKYGC